MIRRVVGLVRGIGWLVGFHLGTLVLMAIPVGYILGATASIDGWTWARTAGVLRGIAPEIKSRVVENYDGVLEPVVVPLVTTPVEFMMLFAFGSARVGHAYPSTIVAHGLVLGTLGLALAFAVSHLVAYGGETDG